MQHTVYVGESGLVYKAYLSCGGETQVVAVKSGKGIHIAVMSSLLLLTKGLSCSALTSHGIKFPVSTIFLGISIRKHLRKNNFCSLIVELQGQIAKFRCHKI